MGPPARFALDDDIKRALEAFPPIWSHPSRRGPHYLTNQELKVLKMIGLGMTNEEIGKALFIERITVRAHVKQIYAKCDIKGRMRLAVISFTIWERGLWVEPQVKRKAMLEAAE